MRAQGAIVVAAASLLLAAVPVSAHHAFAAEFDAKKPVALEGTVTSVEWINPHSWIHLAVKGPDGKVEEWMIETGTVGTLVRRGLTKAMLPAGAVIKVRGYRAKDGSRKANGRDATFADGRQLGLGSSGTGAPNDTQKK